MPASNSKVITERELRSLTRMAYGLLFVGAAGLVAGVAFGIWRLPFRFLADDVEGIALIVIIGSCTRVAAKCIRALDARMTHLEQTTKHE